MSPQEAPKTEQKASMFVQEKNTGLLADFYDGKKMTPLGACDLIRYDNFGSLYYLTYHYNPHIEELPKKFILVAKDNPTGDIFSADKRQREIRVNRITQLEIGIRQMDHILEKTRTKERGQLKAFDSRATELTQLFLTNFSAMTPAEFEHAQAQTRALLQIQGLNFERLIDDEKARIAGWLLKASLGKDTLNRYNLLVSKLALDAVRFHVRAKLLHTDKVEEKFVRIREVLLFERALSQTVLINTSGYLQSRDFSPALIYRRSVEDKGRALAACDVMLSQLNEIHVNPYRPAALRIKSHIFDLKFMITNSRTHQADGGNLADEVAILVQDTLEKAASQYPKL